MERIGEIWVDAGIVMVGDPCYTLPDDGTYRDRTAKNWSAFCNELAAGDIKQGIAPFGTGIALVVESGYGDGAYPVSVERDHNGRVTKLVVDFT